MQVVTTEHLVPSAGDRFVGRRHEAEQHIAQRLAALDKGGAGEVEGARPIVQQRRIGGPQRRRHRGVAFMAG